MGSLVIGLSCIGAAAVALCVALLVNKRQLASLENGIQALLRKVRCNHDLARRQVEKIDELSSAVTKTHRTVEELDCVREVVEKLLGVHSFAVETQNPQILAELRRMSSDLEKMVRQMPSDREIDGPLVLTRSDAPIFADVDSATARVSADLLSLLENNGRESAVARLTGLDKWLAERAPQLKAFPLLSSGDLWLAIILSVGDSNLGTVLPTLDTVIGAGPITDWFECQAYDGTTPLHHSDIVRPACAIRDSSTEAWRVMHKGLIRREVRREAV